MNAKHLVSRIAKLCAAILLVIFAIAPAANLAEVSPVVTRFTTLDFQQCTVLLNGDMAAIGAFALSISWSSGFGAMLLVPAMFGMAVIRVSILNNSPAILLALCGVAAVAGGAPRSYLGQMSPTIMARIG